MFCRTLESLASPSSASGVFCLCTQVIDAGKCFRGASKLIKTVKVNKCQYYFLKKKEKKVDVGLAVTSVIYVLRSRKMRCNSHPTITICRQSIVDYLQLTLNTVILFISPSSAPLGHKYTNSFPKTNTCIKAPPQCAGGHSITR